MALRHVNPCVRSCVRLIGSRFYSTGLRMTAKCAASTVGWSKLTRQNVVTVCVSGFHHSHSVFSDIVTVVTPPFVESVSEGDVFFEKEVGAHVKVDEVIAHIETDKITLPVISPVDGVIDSFLVNAGTRVTPGVPIIQLDVSPKKPESPSSFKFEKSLYFEPKPDPKHPAEEKKLAEHRTEIGDEVPEVDTSEYPVSGKERRVKMSRMRMKIAERLKESQNTAATLTTLNEIDMSNLISIRKTYGEEFSKKHGIKLGFMSSFVKACVYAINDQPVLNAYIEGNEIVYRDNIDVGVAVASPKGLVVPVIRDAQQLTYSEIENAIRDLGMKARDGRLVIEDMQGGTFTISNGGIFGGLFGTPIINHSQSSILGMYSIKERPVAIDGQVVVRPMMYVALSYDHRLIDGREAVTFLSKIKRYIENPVVSILGL